MHPQKASKRAL